MESFMEIYQPSDDSYLLAKYVAKYVKENDRVLDMGCGSGIQSEQALSRGAIVTGVDINPKAVRYCQNSPYTNKGKYILSNLFSHVPKRKYDIICFNPPYLPDEHDPGEIRTYTTGGTHGYEKIESFINSVNGFLDENSIILLVFSDKTKKNKVNEILEKHLFEYKLLEEKPLFFEKLYCYKIRKSDLLKTLNKKKITNPFYFARGKRGLIYKATYAATAHNKKDCVVKIPNKASDRISTIEKEAESLRFVNKFGIGPKLYYADKEVAVIEFIDGEFILDYLESNKKDKSKIKKVLMSILDQMHTLDKHQFEKLEMTRPLRHIIVKKSRANAPPKPVLIDFERARKTPRPKNVTQYLQFLASPRINGKYIKINKNKVIKLGKDYMKDYILRDIKKYLLNRF